MILGKRQLKIRRNRKPNRHKVKSRQSEKTIERDLRRSYIFFTKKNVRGDPKDEDHLNELIEDRLTDGTNVPPKPSYNHEKTGEQKEMELPVVIESGPNLPELKAVHFLMEKVRKEKRRNLHTSRERITMKSGALRWLKVLMQKLNKYS